MKKVVRIIGRLNVGGPAIHTVLLTDLLDSDRYETLLVTGSEGATEGSMRYIAEERGVPLTAIPEMGREISWQDDVRALFKLVLLLRREKPDIVHTHTAKAGTLGRIAALIALPLRQKKLFHTFHGHVFHSYFSKRTTNIFVQIERVLGHFTTRLIAVSDKTRDEVIAYGVARPEKVVTIPLGLDLDSFTQSAGLRGELRSELGICADTLLVGIVARLVPVKAIDDFLAAAVCVTADRDNVRFLIVGDGELREALEQRAAELGLSDTAIFLGYRRDLQRIYADLDVTVLSSLNEGLPVSIIEAMASGRAVVATDVGGVAELVLDGQTGLLVPAQSPEKLAAAIERILADPQLRNDLGDHARTHVVDRYHIRRLVQDIEQLYDTA